MGYIRSFLWCGGGGGKEDCPGKPFWSFSLQLCLRKPTFAVKRSTRMQLGHIWPLVGRSFHKSISQSLSVAEPLIYEFFYTLLKEYLLNMDYTQS